VKILSLGIIFSFLLWSLLLSFFGHYLVKGVITCKKASAHRNCFLLSFFCFIAFLVFFVFVPSHFFFAEFIFLSLLITISASDFCTFFIPTLLTLGFIPLGCISALYNYLPITFTQSIIGTVFGYTVLQFFSHIYKKKTGIQGIGGGDFDMLALIGAFTGFYGVWSALTIGSALGSCLGIIYYFKEKTFLHSPFPFGPLLALGTYCYLIYSFIFY
jgi:leader peptidase (prepilin peptidase)/N-methyltransferase